MKNQAMKFEFNGSIMKMFFRYPNRIVAKLTQEEKEQIAAEEKVIEFKKSVLQELLESASNISQEDFKIVWKKTERIIRRGTGPVTTEFHIVEETGIDPVSEKSIYAPFGENSSVKFHTSSKRNSYEAARQYAIHTYFEKNDIKEDSEIYKLIVEAYIDRSPTAVPFVDKEQIEEEII